MIFAGCDIGSLTGKAVLIKDNRIISTQIIRVLSDPVRTAKVLMDATLEKAGLAYDSITRCCTTGYGRENIPFSNMNISEISCHGMGAHWLDNSIRTILDIGAEDSKIILIDEKGRVIDFAMNDKCAAGTGRCLDKLSKAINLRIEDIGGVSLKSRNPVNMTNVCSIYMELEVIRHLYEKTKIKDIAYGIHDAVASRIAYLAKSVKIEREITMTGGVSRNKGMIRSLGKILNVRFKQLSVEPQLAGAVGAAIFAMKEESNG
ncbi:MAG: 2-hydroxyglutaryl-CoA dehydratase [Smithella sp. SDB]|nr:MAG: 2-hydroxyglutaryl-CoA dehydratase [Smithella sp. SDB]